MHSKKSFVPFALVLAAGLATGPSMAAGAKTYESLSNAVRVGATAVRDSSGGIARRHDFGPSGGFVDPQTGVPNLATILTATQGGMNLLRSGAGITKDGVMGRVEWTPTAVVTTNLAGEGQVGQPCRAQASSYEIAPDIPLVWRLRFQVGGSSASDVWTMLPTGQDPVLLWQVKAPDHQPSLAMIVDTDDTDPTRLMLTFSEKGGASRVVKRVGAMRGLISGQVIDVRVSAVLDEREIVERGAGRWRAWVNGKLVLSRKGPTLARSAILPHQWFFGLYRYEAACPSGVSRTVRWEQLLLEKEV